VSWVVPLPVAIPLLGAALVAVLDHFTPTVLKNAIALASAACATAASVVVMLRAERGDVLHWFGGWHPTGGVALGVGFAADPLGAGMAVLACALVTLSLLYSWSFMRDAALLYDVLMLVFCAGMAGFALTGDLFNMFVWFEVMGVAAYALAGFKADELGPLQGAVNFAIVNTVGAYLVLIGIGLVYARTGALNLAQLGRVLARGPADRLVVVALALVVVGFLVKAAIVPFHWWLADAHAVAPAPVCVLFSGAMVELGLLGVARTYWTVFEGPAAGHAGDVRALLVWLGVVTSVVGAVMCFLQRHLKRLLAFSTIAHTGVMLVGIGLLTSKGLAGTADLALSHGLVKGALFLVCGVLLMELKAVDELRLHGRARRMRVWALVWGLGTLALVGVPYVGVFVGHSLVDDAALEGGFGWLPPLLMVVQAVSSAAVLRAGARVFLGWGARDDPLLSEEPPDEPSETGARLGPLLAVTAAAVIAGLAVSLVPGLQQRTEAGAERFVDRSAYVERVLHGTSPAHPRLPFTLEPATTPSLLYGAGAAVLTLAVAAGGLWHRRLPGAVERAAARSLGPPVEALRGLHSGIVGDYLLWLVVGTAAVGGVWALTLR
jgi:multicomponent Na+:H+ antiporter subunit D